MCMPWKWFSLAVCMLAFAALATAQITSNTYNAATNFEQGWTTTKSNPNGVWSYGYSSGFTNPVTLYNARCCRVRIQHYPDLGVTGDRTRRISKRSV